MLIFLIGIKNQQRSNYALGRLPRIVDKKNPRGNALSTISQSPATTEERAHLCRPSR